MNEITHKQKIGRVGEDIAIKYLENKGFEIIEQNYRKKYGEIDIIAQKGKILHFIEVKSVSCATLFPCEGSELENKKYSCGESFPHDVSYVTDGHRPEDNIHAKKLKRLSNTLQVYLFEKFPKVQPEWVFDVITVRLSMETRQARVKFLENLIL